jgi:hypothetical protein
MFYGLKKSLLVLSATRSLLSACFSKVYPHPTPFGDIMSDNFLPTGIEHGVYFCPGKSPGAHAQHHVVSEQPVQESFHHFLFLFFTLLRKAVAIGVVHQFLKSLLF